MACLVLVGLVWSATPLGFGQQALVRSKASFVVVDVTVLDRSGQPVTGLALSDFELRENGRNQAPSVFSEVRAETHLPRNSARLPPQQPDMAPPPRLFVIVLDDAMLPPDPQITETARKIARRVVDLMGPTDVAAVMFTQSGNKGVEPTTDHAVLRKAIESVRPGFGGGPLAEQASVSTLRTIADALARHDQRATIAFIGIGLPLDSAVLTGATPIGAIGDPQGRAGALHSALLETLALAHRTNATFYTFDATGPSGMVPLILARNPRMKMSDVFERARPYKEFMEVIAENTGGRAAVNTNAFDHAVGRMFLESGSYYLLGYQSTDARQEGRYRRLEVRVKRRGVQVRARSGYWEDRAPRQVP